MTRKYVARQVIADSKGKSFAYELLCRGKEEGEKLVGEAASKEFFTTLSVNFEPSEVTLGTRAFVFLPRAAILSSAFQNMESSQFVFGFSDDVRFDKELVARIETLRKKHFQFALWDYDGKRDFSNIEKSLSYIKMNFHDFTPERHKELVYEHKKRKRKTLMIDGINSKEDFFAAKELGYDLFQGDYFAQPILEMNEDIGFNHSSVVMLMKELNEEECDFNKIDRLINTDVGLTYRLLARGNTMAFAGKSKFTTASQVVVRMGIEELQRWATLTLMQETAVPGQEEKLEHALLRAMFLEGLAVKMNPAIRPQDRYYIYLKGMFSIFPEEKREEIFNSLNYNLTQAMFDEANDLVIFNYAYETANYELIDEYLQEKGLTEAIVMGCYKSAITNVSQALNGE